MVRANKCVVLVTNALQFIRDATNIIVLDNGSIIEQGSFSQLVSYGGIFSDMMSTHAEGMATADDARSRDVNTNNNNSSNSTPLSSPPLTLSNNNQDTQQQKKKNSDNSQKQVAKKAEQDTSNASKGQLISNEDRNVLNDKLFLFLLFLFLKNILTYNYDCRLEVFL